MKITGWVGCLASLLVSATFCMQGLVALRAMAIARHIAFVAHAHAAGIGPVLVLHMLLPMNVYRLSQFWRAHVGRVQARRKLNARPRCP